MNVRAAILASLLVSLNPASSHAARGGPDAGGWTWADSREPGISPNVELPAVVTTIVSPPGADEGVYPIDLGFSFTLYGTTSSRIWLSTNGWFSLVDPALAAIPLNQPIPSPGSPDAIGAWLWDDLSLALAEFGPNSRGAVVQMTYLHPVLRIWVLGKIEFLRSGALAFYYDAAPPMSTVSIGIENGSGTAGTQIAFDGIIAPDVSPTSPYAVMFYPPSPLDCSSAPEIICPTPIAGTTLGGPANVNNYSCDAASRTGAERVYQVEQRRGGRFQASLTDLAGRDLALYLVGASCHPGFECLAPGATTLDIASVPRGTYYLVVDGATAADDGDFTLTVAAGDADCNKNGIGDNCDLVSGTATDCNLDGRPDECGTCPVDVVFVMDTSGSMAPYFSALCTAITDTIARLSLEAIDFTSQAWGITDNGSTCLTDNVRNRLGTVVPGPPPPLPPLDRLTDSESWGQATSIVAGLYPWTPGSVRMVVPIGDEGPFLGTPVNDPGDDRDVVTQAISVCLANNVIASPITPDISNPANVRLAQDLAAGTGGTWSSTGTDIGEAIVTLVRDACALFTASADAGADVAICGPTTVTLDGSASRPDCPGGIEYRWLEGPTELCGTWSTTPTCEVNPTADTTYTLEVRCITSPGCVFYDSMEVTATSAPLPASLGNTLFATRNGLDVVLLWSPVTGAVGYDLDRGTVKQTWPPVRFLTGLPTTVTLPDVPEPPAFYLYRAVGVNCAGEAGP